MTREEMYQNLLRMRSDIKRMRQETDSPAVDNALREMGVYLYNAMIYLGDPDELFPEDIV